MGLVFVLVFCCFFGFVFGAILVLVKELSQTKLAS